MSYFVTNQEQKELLESALYKFSKFMSKKQSSRLIANFQGNSSVAYDNHSYFSRSNTFLACYFGVLTNPEAKDIPEGPEGDEQREALYYKYHEELKIAFDTKDDLESKKKYLDQIFDFYDNFDPSKMTFDNEEDYAKLIFVETFELARQAYINQFRDYIDQRYDTDEKRAKFERKCGYVHATCDLYGVADIEEIVNYRVNTTSQDVINFPVSEYDRSTSGIVYEIAKQLNDNPDADISLVISNKIAEIVDKYKEFKDSGEEKMPSDLSQALFFIPMRLLESMQHGDASSEFMWIVGNDKSLGYIYDRVFVGGKALSELCKGESQFEQACNIKFLQALVEGKEPVDIANISLSMQGVPKVSVNRVLNKDKNLDGVNGESKEDIEKRHDAIAQIVKEKNIGKVNPNSYKEVYQEKYIKECQDLRKESVKAFNNKKEAQEKVAREMAIYNEFKAKFIKKYNLSDSAFKDIDGIMESIAQKGNSKQASIDYSNYVLSFLTKHFKNEIASAYKINFNLGEKVAELDNLVNMGFAANLLRYAPFADSEKTIIETIVDGLDKWLFGINRREMTWNKRFYCLYSVSCGMKNIDELTSSDEIRASVEQIRDRALNGDPKPSREDLIEMYKSAVGAREDTGFFYWLAHPINSHYERKAISQIKQAIYNTVDKSKSEAEKKAEIKKIEDDLNFGKDNAAPPIYNSNNSIVDRYYERLSQYNGKSQNEIYGQAPLRFEETKKFASETLDINKEEVNKDSKAVKLSENSGRVSISRETIQKMDNKYPTMPKTEEHANQNETDKVNEVKERKK